MTGSPESEQGTYCINHVLLRDVALVIGILREGEGEEGGGGGGGRGRGREKERGE